MWLKVVNEDKQGTKAINLAWAANISIDSRYEDAHYIEVRQAITDDSFLIGPFIRREEAEGVLISVFGAMRNGQTDLTIMIANGRFAGQY